MKIKSRLAYFILASSTLFSPLMAEVNSDSVRSQFEDKSETMNFYKFHSELMELQGGIGHLIPSCLNQVAQGNPILNMDLYFPCKKGLNLIANRLPENSDVKSAVLSISQKLEEQASSQTMNELNVFYKWLDGSSSEIL